MAAKGTPQPYGGVPIAGQSRNAVIANLGPPKQSIGSDGRRVEVYEYKTAHEPSPWRAIVHGILDVSSLGLWEIIGTPIEMAQGEKVRVAVEYDENGSVLNAAYFPVKVSYDSFGFPVSGDTRVQEQGVSPQAARTAANPAGGQATR
jgi:hypothetical protein